MSSAGDVNGDGIGDLLIGAYAAEPNGSYSGASYVVFGRNTAQTGPFPSTLNLSILDGTNGFHLNGVAAGDSSGRAVSSAGDVNGDGLADLLIGARTADPNGGDSGASYVVFGRNTVQTGPFPASRNLSVLDGTNGFRLDGIAAGDRSGAAVSSAGDVNGDGIGDLVIGAYRADPNGTDSGASYVVFGEPPLPPPVTPPPGPRPVSTCQARTCGVRLTCQDSSTACTSPVNLTVRASALKRGRDQSASAKPRRRVTFAAAVVNVPPGRTGTFKLRLTKKGRKFVKQQKVKRLQGRLEVRNISGALVSNTPISIRLITRRP